MPDTKQEQSAFEKSVRMWICELRPEEGNALLKILDEHLREHGHYDPECNLCRARSRISLGRDYDEIENRIKGAALQAAYEAVCYLCAEHKPVFQPKDDNADHCGFQHHWDSGSAHHVYTCCATRIRALLSKPEGSES